MKIGNKWKAVVGGLSTFLAVVATAMADDVIGLDEAPGIITAAIILGGVVYGAVWAKAPATGVTTPTKETQ